MKLTASVSKPGLTILAFIFLSQTTYGMDLSIAKGKALEITKKLAKFYQKSSFDLKEIEEYKNGKRGTAVKSIYCNKKTLDLPNGNQGIGTSCTVGVGSGFLIDFDSKLNPIKISYFVP